MAERTCEAEDCAAPHRARGLCRRHYKVQYEMHDATCVMCSEVFRGHRTDAKFCSDECKALDYMDRPKPKRVCPLPHEHPVMQQYRLPVVWTPPIAEQAAARRRQCTWVAGRCEWCATSFVALAQTSHPYRYCSRRCLRQVERARHGRFTIPDVRRRAIYERDNWTCQLCMDPVDPNLPTSDQWAATLDHIECQAWAEQPNHGDDNLRLAHRWCNSVRGDERHHTAAVLAA